MYDNTTDVNNWFADKAERKRYEYDLNDKSVVIDLGGYHGEFAKRISATYGCRVCVFEPIAKFFDLCVATNKGNPKIHVYQAGISGNTQGSVEISIEEDASSIYRTDKCKKTETIQLMPVTAIFESGVDRIDLFKINVEGAEYDILDKLIETGYIKNVDNIQVQFHNFVPNAEERRLKIQTELAKTHHLTYHYPFVWENWAITRE